MLKILQNLAVPAAVAASVLIGCSSPPPITDRTDAARPSSVQVSEGYDTLGRKWADQTPSPAPAPAPAPAATPQMLTREDFVLLHGTGLITAIDHADREKVVTDADLAALVARVTGGASGSEDGRPKAHAPAAADLHSTPAEVGYGHGV